ncbi:MAG: ParB/RepB/Spo0J family partition protein [Oscillospiraceae bacterium]|nr:ParB/RepB/Spo0J family partition protein [Oscillospiraceae bacterium]
MARKSEKKTEGSFNDLFFDNGSDSAEGAQTLRISEIEPNKDQPRKHFDKEALQQLADSIGEHGVIQPLIVRSMPDGSYRIVAGERRWRAAKMAGLSEIPVVIRDDLTDEEAMQIAMIENLQRENLNPIEEALGYKELLDKYSITQDKLAKALGKARSSITNSLGLLTMPNAVQELLRNGSLSVGHCKALKKIKDEAVMIELAHKTAEGELSVRQVEAIARREGKNAEVESKRIKQKLTYYTEVEVSLCEILGTKVKINEGKSGNVLQIKFKDKEELENILARFQDE